MRMTLIIETNSMKMKIVQTIKENRATVLFLLLSENADAKNQAWRNGMQNMDKNSDRKEENKLEREKHRDERIEQTGQVTLDRNKEKQNIHLLTIIGEVEGHDNLNSSAKTTKYEHILPQLAAIEDSQDIQGVLVLLNTVGGDVEAGLAIAEMLASLSKPTVSLVLGGSHSIGVPIAVSTDYSFIVPTGTMVIHPVRMNGMVIGVPQTFDYFKQIQDRITGFVCMHCDIQKSRLEELMMETGVLTKDVGTILVGQEAVDEGIINRVGGIREAMEKLHRLISDISDRK
jgi:ATP-dependent protease ClpP protease subunit